MQESPKPLPSGIRGWLKILFSGMCVGAADIVPGISGGTVAFIIGIYEDLLKSIATINFRAGLHLCTLNIRAFFRSVAWQFLCAFLLGVSFSFFTLAKGFNSLLNHEVYRPYLYSAFMGLVVGSVIFCAKLLSGARLKTFCFLLLGALSAYFLSGVDFKPENIESQYDVPVKQEFLSRVEERSCRNYDPATHRLLNVGKSELSAMVAKKYLAKEDLIYGHSEHTLIAVESLIQSSSVPFIDFWVVACGAMAISAMLLPGISGSYLLNILGMYGFILGALVDWVEGLKVGVFDLDAFRVVLSMFLGIVLGALCFARVVSFLLARYRQVAIASLVGFMIGALRAVWPFWTYGYELSCLHLADGPMLQVIEPVLPTVFSWHFVRATLFFIGGLSSVFIIESIAARKTKALCQT